MHSPHRSPLSWLGIALALVAGGLGLVSLAAWWSGHWHALAGGDTVPMAPSTGLLFLLLGSALAASLLRPAARAALGFLLITTLAVVVLSTHLFFMSLRGVPPEWERWLAGTPGTIGNAIPLGVMSPLTAVVFVLSSLSLLALSTPAASRRWVVWGGYATSALGGGFALIIVLAYASDTPLFYGGTLVPMALSTALAFLALHLALLVAGPLGQHLAFSWIASRANALPETEQVFRRRLVIVATLITVAFMAAGFINLRRTQTSARELARVQLEAFASLKAEEVRRWREERLGEARFLQRTPAVASDLLALLDHPQDTAARARVASWLEPIKGGDRYESVMVFDPAGQVLLSIPSGHAPHGPAQRAAAARWKAARAISFTDLHRDSITGTAHLDVIVPLYPVAGTPEAPPRGGIVLRINPERTLFPMISQWPTAGSTGEVLLLRREGDEVVYLNTLRHRTGPMLHLRLPIGDRLHLASKAGRGETGIVEGRNYRGVAVLGAARHVPDSPWVLVAQVDLSEIYQPLLAQAAQTGTLVLFLFLSVLLGAIAIWRSRRADYLHRALSIERENAALTRRFRVLMEHAHDCIVLFDHEGRILEANHRAIATYGYSLEELRALPPGALQAPATPPSCSESPHPAAMPDGECFKTLHRRKDGSLLPVEVSTGSVEIDGHRIRLGICRDITERHRHETQIARLTRLYAALSAVNQTIIRSRSREQLFAAICRVLVEHGGFCYARIGWRDPITETVTTLAQFGHEGDYLFDAPIRTNGDSAECGITGEAIRGNRTCVSNDVASDPRLQPWREDTTRHGFRAGAAIPIRAADNAVGALTVYAGEGGIFGEQEVRLLEEAASDISFALVQLEHDSQRHTALAALRASEARFRALFANSLDGFMLTTPDGQVLAANPSACHLLRRTEEQILSAGRHALTDSADPRLALLLSERARTGRAQGELTFLRGDGTRFEAEVASVVFDTDDGPRTSMVIRDITARKAAEHRIREQAALLDKATEGIIVAGLDDRITFWNHGAERLFGYSSAEMLGRSTTEPTLLDLNAIPPEALSTADATGQWLGETHGSQREGRQLRLGTHITVVHDDAGVPTARLFICTDITERKQIEEQLLRAQRLESVGMLAAGIAHDLNNVLAPILMSAALVQQRLTNPADKRLLGTIEKSAERGAALVRQILGFAHGIGGEPRPLQTKHLMRDLVEVIQATYPRSITLEAHIPSELWPIVGNPTQIHQVLLNLCVNARDAMPDGGTLRLRAENHLFDTTTVSRWPEARPGPWICLSVEDTGTGIPPEIIPSIWSAFFTTKSADKGTGLGLATVRGIVTTHHGFITVDSTVGRGTTFAVYLPADESALPAIATNAPLLTAHGRGETILFVDDEECIRDLGKSILRHAGYRALTATDGMEAVSLFATHAPEIALIVTDLDMPRLGGIQLAERARNIRPDVKLLAISGAALRSRHTDDLAKEFPGPLLQKPFSPEDLLAEIHRILHPTEAA